MDLVDTGDAFQLTADLPGVAEADVDLEAHDGVLTLRGSRAADASDHLRTERPSGAFERSFQLPEGTDPTAIGASFDRGVLTVTVPKPEQAQPHKVTIGAAPAAPAEVEATTTD